MTTKIQKAMASGRVMEGRLDTGKLIAETSEQADAQDIERQLAEQEDQVQDRKAQ